MFTPQIRKLLDTDTDDTLWNDLYAGLDQWWLLFGSYIVFFMQTGFALLEAGSVRAKNTKNILLKNVLDACLGALVWWFVGYPMAYGEGGPQSNDFIGGTNFFMSDSPSGYGYRSNFYSMWMFQWAFAAAAATIVSGAVAERCDFRAYLIYTTIITGFIYPVVVHWGWSGEGWLSAFRSIDSDGVRLGSIGMIDFAGSGIVHMTGGAAALTGACFLGPRNGRFQADGTVVDIPGHSTVLAALGTFILWFGWYGFNPCSTLAFEYMAVAQKVAVTTTLSAAAGGCGVLTLHVGSGKPPDVAPALNGILGGLVSITAGCPVVEPYGAAIIGGIGAVLYFFCSKLLHKLRIDDPLDAAPVHFFCGAWGVISVGFFATEYSTKFAYGTTTDWGIFYGAGPSQLGIQCLGVLSIAGWSAACCCIMFGSLKALNILRVPFEDEMMGLDESHHGGAAYDFQPAQVADTQK